MGVDLRIYIVDKTKVNVESQISLLPVATLEMVRRSDLFDKIEGLPAKFIKAPICFENTDIRTDAYGQDLMYINCEELAEVILNYNEEFRKVSTIHRNDAFAALLKMLADRCVAVTYWQ